MIIQLNEYDHCFAFDCEAETVEDAALLMHLGLNARKELQSLVTSTYSKSVWASAILKKIRNTTNFVSRMP